MDSQRPVGQLDGIDLETAVLILRVQLAHSEQLAEPNNNGEIQPDDDLAIRMSREEMENFTAVLRDRILAEAVGNGLEPDNAGAIVLIAQLKQCSVCSEEFHDQDIADLACEHKYCVTCIQEVFSRSFVDEQIFPPRCCRQPIDPENVTNLLTAKIIEDYHAKAIEFGTVDRLYCANAACSRFFPPATIQGAAVAECQSCHTTTCTTCKAASHEGDCPLDEDVRLLRGLATQEGWKSCPNCHRMVELAHGCFHITCLCGTEFCYLCQATPWKTCPCEQWDEERLVARAQNRVQVNRRAEQLRLRPAEPQNPAPAARQPVNNVREILNRHGRCRHYWNMVRGQLQCNMCERTIPQYLHRCLRCRLEICTRCRDTHF